MSAGYIQMQSRKLLPWKHNMLSIFFAMSYNYNYREARMFDNIRNAIKKASDLKVLNFLGGKVTAFFPHKYWPNADLSTGVFKCPLYSLVTCLTGK